MHARPQARLKKGVQPPTEAARRARRSKGSFQLSLSSAWGFLSFLPSFMPACARRVLLKRTTKARTTVGRRGRVALLPACTRVIPTLLTAPSSTGASRRARVALGAFAEIENVQDGHKVPSDRKCSTAQYYYCGTYVVCTAI